jgi:hypothetical protein
MRESLVDAVGLVTKAIGAQIIEGDGSAQVGRPREWKGKVVEHARAVTQFSRRRCRS